jgi:hypothetical protein
MRKNVSYCEISTIPGNRAKIYYWVMPMVPSSLDVSLGLPGVSYVIYAYVPYIPAATFVPFALEPFQ